MELNHPLTDKEKRLIESLKADGIWDKLDVMMIEGRTIKGNGPNRACDAEGQDTGEPLYHACGRV